MGESKRINKLYEDAIYWHLISEGYSDYIAKMQAKQKSEHNELH